jgi:perosamine synthetase
MIPYGKQTIDEEDINVVIKALKEPYLTTGPKVNEFEEKFANFCDHKYAVAINSGTAALHLATHAIGIGPGDEVIVTCLSFVASANCILYEGGTPIFADIESDTMNIDPTKLEKHITDKTKAIIVVDFAGQLCKMEEISRIAKKHKLALIEDAAHSLGAKDVGKYADITTFSFHPVKNMTTGEGGMCITDNEKFYKDMKCFRTHGINVDYKERERTNSYYYEMIQLGFNYRITDIQCALGINQLKRLPGFIKKRKKIAVKYDNSFKEIKDLMVPLTNLHDNAYHIYIIKLNLDNLSVDRDIIYKKLKERGIGTNVHYLPIHLHPYYKNRFGTGEGLCPAAENVYKQIITLPIYPTLTDEQIDKVISTVKEVLKEHQNMPFIFKVLQL